MSYQRRAMGATLTHLWAAEHHLWMQPENWLWATAYCAAHNLSSEFLNNGWLTQAQFDRLPI